MNQNTKEPWEGKFDEQFGVSVEKDGYEFSKGRSAGCDDCEMNQALRQEHKEFIHSLLQSQKNELVEDIARAPGISLAESGTVEMLGGFFGKTNTYLKKSDIIELINKK